MTAEDARALVADTGCTADVYWESSSTPNGGYAPYAHAIILYGLDQVPYSWAAQVAAHEAGHCLQMQDGTLGTLPSPEQEWDADRRAIAYFAGKGIDIVPAMDSWWAWIYQKFGYKGNNNGPHGLLTERMTRLHLNRHLSTPEAL